MQILRLKRLARANSRFNRDQIARDWVNWLKNRDGQLLVIYL